MTIMVEVDDFPLEQVTKQLNKLINVIKIVEQDPAHSVSRELVMIKVRADASQRGEVLEVVNLFRARIIDVAPESLTVEATGTDEKLDALLRMLDPTGSVRSPSPVRSRLAVDRGACRAIGSPCHQQRRGAARQSKSTNRPAPPRHIYEGNHCGSREVLRRRRRSVDHPGPQGRRHRLRQPGPRPLAVAARFRRRRRDRPARGLEVA